MEGGRGQLGVEIRASLWTGVLGTLTPDGLSVSDCRGLCVFVESGKEKKNGVFIEKRPSYHSASERLDGTCFSKWRNASFVMSSTRAPVEALGAGQGCEEGANQTPEHSFAAGAGDSSRSACRTRAASQAPSWAAELTQSRHTPSCGWHVSELRVKVCQLNMDSWAQSYNLKVAI